jgi:hypothetical protein
MRTYGMIVPVSAEEGQAARDEVSRFLAKTAANASEHQLAIEGLRYLRSARS